MSYFVAQPIGLGYAYFDGTTWHTETVESTGYVGNFSSLALDASGQPHVIYHGGSDGDLRYAWKECIPVEGAEITGPGVLLAGETGWYAASYTPPTATQPVTLFWDNGTLGPTAAYSWTLPGVYTLTLTAANECGMVTTSFTVTIECRPVGGEIAGPALLRVGETGLYTATYTPPTATLPITFTWDNGTLGPTAAYSWTVGGTYTIAVTGTNICGGEAVGRFPVQVIWPYCIYLPLVVREE